MSTFMRSGKKRDAARFLILTGLLFAIPFAATGGRGILASSNDDGITLDIDRQDKLRVGIFSSEYTGSVLPDNWKEMTFRGLKSTRYELVENDIRVVVRAESNNSSSGLIRRKEIDFSEYPVIEWSWKVENILEKGDVYGEDGDDYPARIYVIFDYDLSNLGWGTRNMIRLLRRIYGEEPPPVGGLAIMTDSDDTGESAVAYFGDICFLRE